MVGTKKSGAFGRVGGGAAGISAARAHAAEGRGSGGFTQFTDEPATWETIDNRMLQLAALDMDTYVLVRREVDKLSRDSSYGNRFAAALTHGALAALNREPTTLETQYAALRIRFRYSHTKARNELKMHNAVMIKEAIYLCLPTVRKEMEAQREMLRRDAMLTRDDVLQGMMNAVQLASDSFETLQAWKEIGKYLGYYEETKIKIEQKIQQEVHHTHKLEGMDLRTIDTATLMQQVGGDLLERLKPAMVIEHKPQPTLEQSIEEAVFTEVPRGDAAK